jgi:hypothetical protein
VGGAQTVEGVGFSMSKFVSKFETNKSQKVIAVTGGAGFVGSHLCDALVENGNFVVCLDNLSTSPSVSAPVFRASTRSTISPALPRRCITRLIG